MNGTAELRGSLQLLAETQAVQAARLASLELLEDIAHWRLMKCQRELADELYRYRLTKAGFNPNEPRDGHGMWTGGGGGLDLPGLADLADASDGSDDSGDNSDVPQLIDFGSDSDVNAFQNPKVADDADSFEEAGANNKAIFNDALDQDTQSTAEAIFGETSGLTPILKSAGANPYNEKNWDPDSAEQLQMARSYIGIVSERNPQVHFATPNDLTNPIQARIWNNSLTAAMDEDADLDPDVTNFFLRQEGIGRQKPNWPGLEKIISLGPFNNLAGGGDVPKGANTYIDFYGKLSTLKR